MKKMRPQASPQKAKPTALSLGVPSSSGKKANEKEGRIASLHPLRPPRREKMRNRVMAGSFSKETAMGASHAILQALMNAPQDAVGMMDYNGQILDANQTLCNFLGLPRRDLIGRHARDFVPAEVAKEWRAIFHRASKKFESLRFETERNGRHFDCVVYPVVESNKRSSKVVVISRDITELKKAEETIRQSEERYRLVIERTGNLVSIATFSDPPRYVYINPSYNTILGYRPEDLIGKSPFDFMHPDDKEQSAAMVQKYLRAKSQGLLLRGGKAPTVWLLYRLKDAWGNWHYFEGTADLIEEDHALMVSRDVSERIRAERELERVRKELEAKVEERTRDLKMRSQSLEETTTALKVLMEMREQDRKKLERIVLLNVNTIAEPYLEKLKESPLDKQQKEYLDILAASLKEILSPISRGLLVNEVNLTPSESRIAKLIKFGKSSKEIARVLNLSIKTIESHRRKIRTKLGLRSRKTNLRSHLLERLNP